MTMKEFLDEYGNEKVSFLFYYKYSFTFQGVAEDCTEITITVGGSTDDIYKFDVKARELVTVKSLCDNFGSEYVYVHAEKRFVDGRKEVVFDK